MKQTYDIRIEELKPLISPEKLKHELPVSAKSAQTVIEGRESIERILNKTDKRVFVNFSPSAFPKKICLPY